MAEENQKETEEKVESQVESKAESTESKAESTESEAAEAETTEESKEEQKEPSLEEKYAALEKENADLKDQLLRRAADFDNYRKRMMKEKQDTYDYANANLLGDLLESLDNFDRTLEAAANATEVGPVVDGIKMISSNLVKMLETKYNLVGYGASGEDFNPDEHEAIGRVEEDVEKETLKQVYLKGYKLKDKVIRHAKVMVSVPKA